MGKSTIGYREIFWIFFKAGLAFGGGLGVLAAVEEELVRKRQAVSRDDFLINYSIGRIAPSGTMTALAVCYGYQFAGFPGTLLALLGLTLPAFTSTIALTMAYAAMKGSPLMTYVPLTLLPAAVAFIFLAALQLGRAVVGHWLDVVLALAALAGGVAWGLSPILVLAGSGLLGALFFRS